MPPKPGALIQTPRGTRHLLNDEHARGLGTPDRWIQNAYPRGRLLRQTVPLHLLEYATPMIVNTLLPVTPPLTRNVRKAKGRISPNPKKTKRRTGAKWPDFNWKPPDLGPHSEWTQQRVLNLLRASLQYPDPGPIIEEGMKSLRRHRQNYDVYGPKPTHLQVLWWEFPPEVWDSLRQGSSMHFLDTPAVGITPNAPMTEEQICIAEEFVNELVELGVLLPTPVHEVLANGPLFTVPKPGQPGQWRIIADLRSGGQNSVSAADPTVFPKAGNILDQMYKGGWTAVVDASKFFYQFITKDAERIFLGCLHPRDPNIRYVYGGLPMGATASPAHAGRYGTAMIRKLRAISPLFQGDGRLNTWWSQYAFGTTYDTGLGHGLNRIGRDGLPAVQVWAHCDDFLIHGPSLDKTQAGVRAFLDLTVQVGMLCNPTNLTPPSQTVRYTGFDFDTHSVPTLRIPDDKSSRATALTVYGIKHRDKLSRLSLAVIVGTLESLVEATPDRIGHTYLRNLQGELHPEGWDEDELPYYSFASLSDTGVEELQMWLWILQVNPGRQARGGRAGTLIPSFGDGSGTGTGGTVQYPTMKSFEMWMGTWSPTVYHFSSNWKELRTLLATLERAAMRADRDDFRGATFFYFTDNVVTYYVVSGGSSTSPELHRMVLQVKRLTLSLGLHLEVVHVPGTLIILEGTDGLSRGIWATPAHVRPDPNRLLSHIFAPVTITPAILSWAQRQVPQVTSPLLYRRWTDPWDSHLIFDTFTFWAPPLKSPHSSCMPFSNSMSNDLVLPPPSYSFPEFYSDARPGSVATWKKWAYMTPTISPVSPRHLPPFLWFCCTFLTMFYLLLLPGWTRLPPRRSNVLTGTLRHLCVGCRDALPRRQPYLRCRFSDTGFTIGDFVAKPCHNAYHPGCLRMGNPFRTRLGEGRGLVFPNDPLAFEHFICEGCTVRAVRGRELNLSASDTVLLMLERARLFDSANHWARSTLRTYRSKLRILSQFERDLACSTMTSSHLEVPPHGPSIRLMWAQERYSLYPAAWRRRGPSEGPTIQFGTVRGIRSAASHYWMADLLATQPEHLTMGFKDRPSFTTQCAPTDELAYTYFTDGMRRRLGDHPRPSAVLLLRHMIWLDRYFDRLFREAVSPEAVLPICQVGLIHALAYLGWLRATEVFSLRWSDVTVTPPEEGPTLGLPDNIGMIQLRLLPQTKSSQTATADLILAYTTASGISPGLWYNRLFRLTPAVVTSSNEPLFRRSSGRTWTSHSYRHQHFYPALYVCQALGDPFLQRFRGTDGQTIPAVFWGFNTYRRTGRTVASKKRDATQRAASPAEVVEHGRWRISRSSLSMPLAYLEWSLADRLCISLLCM